MLEWSFSWMCVAEAILMLADSLLQLLEDILMAYDRSLIVADPRRCEPKKFGGHCKLQLCCKSSCCFLLCPSCTGGQPQCPASFAVVTFCRSLCPLSLPEVLPLSGASYCFIHFYMGIIQFQVALSFIHASVFSGCVQLSLRSMAALR